MYLADIARRVILVVLFDNRTTLGLVRLKMKGTVEELTRLFSRCSARRATRMHQPNILAGADDEIDNCFSRKDTAMSMINYASREINCKIVYYGPGLGGKTTNLEHIYGKVQPGHARQAHLARDGDRAHAVLRFPAGRPRHDSRLQDALPSLHRAGAGVLQRQPQADPQGRRRHRVRGRLADRAHGSESGSDAEPVRQHGRVRLRSVTKMPFVIQYNKRDLPNAAPLAELQAALNPGWEVTETPQAARRARSVSRRRESRRAAADGRMDRAGAVLRGGRGHGRRRVRHAEGGEQAGAQVARLTTARDGAR